MMSDATFEARLRRIAETRPEGATGGAASLPPLAAPPPRPVPWGGIFLVWFFFGPLGLVMRVARQLYMDLTPEAVHFGKLLGFVAATHLLLLCVTVLALIFIRTPGWYFRIALATWAGYGVGSALMALKDFA